MTKKHNAMNRFYAAHTEAFKKYSLPLTTYSPKDQLSESDKTKIMLLLSGERVESTTTLNNLSKENKTLWWLIERFGEIYDSIEYLRDSLVYIQSFPYENTRVTKVRFFRYVAENFLREIYSLDQRLKKFAQKISAEYEQISPKQFDQSNVYKVYSESRKNLKQLIDVRNILVHESRDFDNQLYRLTQLEQRVNVTFAGTKFLDVFENLLEMEYSRAMDERSNDMKYVIQDVEEIVDSFFIGINAIILDKDGSIVFPK